MADGQKVGTGSPEPCVHKEQRPGHEIGWELGAGTLHWSART